MPSSLLLRSVSIQLLLVVVMVALVAAAEEVTTLLLFCELKINACLRLLINSQKHNFRKHIVINNVVHLVHSSVEVAMH